MWSRLVHAPARQPAGSNARVSPGPPPIGGRQPRRLARPGRGVRLQSWAVADHGKRPGEGNEIHVQPTDASGEPPTTGPRRSALVVIRADGVELAREYPLGTTQSSIGREESVDILIPSESVSRRHALLERRDRKWWVLDQGARNGIWVNEARVKSKRRLKSGDRIGIGPVVFLFLDAEAADDASLLSPVAMALRQIEVATTAHKRLLDAALSIELTLKILLSAQIGSLRSSPAARLEDTARRLAVAKGPVSMGMWRRLCIELASLLSRHGSDAVSKACRVLVDPSGAGTDLSAAISEAVELRNRAVHSTPTDDQAFEADATRCVSVAHGLVHELRDLLTLPMISGARFESDVDERTRNYRAYQHNGLSELFPFVEHRLADDLDWGDWCALLPPEAPPLCMAPLFAAGPSQDLGRRVIFSARELHFGAAGTAVSLESLVNRERRQFPLPRLGHVRHIGEAIQSFRSA